MSHRITIPRFDEQDWIRTALPWYRDPHLQVTDASPLPWLWLVAQDARWAWLGKAWGPVLLRGIDPARPLAELDP